MSSLDSLELTLDQVSLNRLPKFSRAYFQYGRQGDRGHRHCGPDLSAPPEGLSPLWPAGEESRPGDFP